MGPQTKAGNGKVGRGRGREKRKIGEIVMYK